MASFVFGGFEVEQWSLRRVQSHIKSGQCCGRNRMTGMISISDSCGTQHPSRVLGTTVSLDFDRNQATEAHAAKIVEFARTRAGQERILIHSHRGQHRGPAAAIIFAAALGIPWKQAVREVLASAKKIAPDLSLLRAGDKVLGTKMARYCALSQKRAAQSE